MKKIIFWILILCMTAFAQQIRYTLGQKVTSGDAWELSDITYLDTVTSSTQDFLIDLNDFYWLDPFPLAITEVLSSPAADSVISTSTVYQSSNYQYLGTFYCYFDVTNAADSIIYTIKAYPGIYRTDGNSFASIAWGSAVTLETVRRVADYFSVNNVYIHSSKYKLFPPELIKIEVAKVTDSDCDDSIAFDWKYAYPQLIQPYRERKDDSDNTNAE